MELRPFTLAEAEEICEDFEDLKDSEFSMSGTLYIVEDVLVSPSPVADKEAFFNAYTAGEETSWRQLRSIAIEFDVIIVVSNLTADEGLSFISITQYVAEKGVRYNFPVD
jgi:hypothetical protein